MNHNTSNPNMSQFYADQFLTRVAREGVEMNPRLLEGSIIASGRAVGYVIEFHANGMHQFEVLKLIWNGIVLQSYAKTIGHTTGSTNFELAQKVVRRVTRRAAKRAMPTRYPNIEWVKF